MTLPPLPASLFSVYGPIPVEIVEDLKDVDTGDTLFGYWDSYKRIIYIRAGLHPAAAWQTLYHELAHAWLLDIGVKLSYNQEEAVVGAVASARLAELLASLTVGSP